MDSPACICAGTISLHRTERARQTTLDALARIECNDAATARHQIHQSLERGFYGVEIFINIGVIKLNRRQDDRVGEIVQKLRTLIEESRVVLIAFEDEVFALSQLEAAAKVFRYPAHQERGL